MMATVVYTTRQSVDCNALFVTKALVNGLEISNCWLETSDGDPLFVDENGKTHAVVLANVSGQSSEDLTIEIVGGRCEICVGFSGAVVDTIAGDS